MSLLWKIGGEAGFGIMTTGLQMSKIVARSGYEVFDYQEYPSLIRGGHNTYEVHLSDEPVFSSKRNIDILACLNKDAYSLHKDRCTESTRIIFDSEDVIPEKGIRVAVPLKKIMKELNTPHIMVNNIALGASLALIGWDLSILFTMIDEVFEKKGKEIIELNKQSAQRGYDYVLEKYKDHIFLHYPVKKIGKKLILTGNDAFSLGAIASDCRMYSAYPMTPASSVLSTLAGYAEKTGMIVRHAEDEISVINTALGSSFAGVRSAVGTSGGGFALMVESISYAGVAEIPIVILLSQRPGPATGMPTWTEQGDLLFAVHAGHGEFPKIILSAGDAEEVFAITQEAFNLADIYQTPVIVLLDKYVSESHWGVRLESYKRMINEYKIERGKIVKSDELKIKYSDTEKETYKRYQDTDDGISNVIIPGTEGFFWQANSYEHLEDGHTTEDDRERIKQVDKRKRKIQTYLKNHFSKPIIFGTQDNYLLTIVSWGGNKGPILDSLKELNLQGILIRYVHFTHLYPLEENVIKSIIHDENKCILIENNSTGQFGRLLRQETGIYIEKQLLKYDGRPIYKEEIVEYVKKIVSGSI